MMQPFALFCDAPWVWVSLGMAGTIRTGISRVEMEASARLLGIEITPATFSDVRIMEEAALTHWSSRRG